VVNGAWFSLPANVAQSAAQRTRARPGSALYTFRARLPASPTAHDAAHEEKLAARLVTHAAAIAGRKLVTLDARRVALSGTGV